MGKYVTKYSKWDACLKTVVLYFRVGITKWGLRQGSNVAHPLSFFVAIKINDVWLQQTQTKINDDDFDGTVSYLNLYCSQIWYNAFSHNPVRVYVTYSGIPTLINKTPTKYLTDRQTRDVTTFYFMIKLRSYASKHRMALYKMPTFQFLDLSTVWFRMGNLTVEFYMSGRVICLKQEYFRVLHQKNQPFHASQWKLRDRSYD